MHKSKLVRTMRILTEEEMKRLQLFLQSPFFNTNSNIVKLYKVLARHHPDYNSPKLAKEEVFKKLFPGKEYAHQQMLNLMSEFYALLEKYLINLQLENKELIQNKLLLEAFSERPNCYDFFEKKFDLLNKNLDGQPFRDDIYFSEKKELNLLYYAHPDTSMQTGDKGTLHKAVEYFEAQKKLTDLKLKCALNARANTLNENQKRELNSQQLLSENQLYILYEKLEKFQHSETEVNIEELTSLFKLEIKLLREDDKRNILKILLNYCIRQINIGNTDFYRTSLDLYKIGLEHDCMLVKGKITKNVFQNIAAAGVNCQEYNWTIDFMENYQKLLDEQVKDDAVALSFGLLYLQKKEYNQAINVLQRNFQEAFDQFKSKTLLIRAWFEIWNKDNSYYDLLLAKLDALEKFARRNKSMRPSFIKSVLISVSYTKKIVESKWNPLTLQKIIQEINSEQSFLFKKFLLEKIA
jgi:hypothetical protein